MERRYARAKILRKSFIAILDINELIDIGKRFTIKNVSLVTETENEKRLCLYALVDGVVYRADATDSIEGAAGVLEFLSSGLSRVKAADAVRGLLGNV